MTDTYYNLPLAHRWLLDLGNPMNIGGRHTDISQIGYSLTKAIKDYYPINRVPDDIADRLEELQALLDKAELGIENFIELVSLDIKFNTAAIVSGLK